MVDSKTCKCKRKPNLTSIAVTSRLRAQLVNENKDTIKGKFGVGVTSKTKVVPL